MRLFVSAFVCVLLCFGAAYAQGDRGTITGTVSDPAGAMIPNAAIEAKNLQTGAVYQTVTFCSSRMRYQRSASNSARTITVRAISSPA